MAHNKKEAPSVLLSVVDNYGGYPFDQIFDVVFPCYGIGDVTGAHDLTNRLAMVIWGGADISPTIYGQRPNRFTGADVKLSERDQIEVAVACKAIELGIPVIGICRGAQLMCALSGGSLVQHVENHAGGWHAITLNDGSQLKCPSLHHQMMYPWFDSKGGTIEHEMLAWCDPVRSNVHFGEEETDDSGEWGKTKPRSIILPGFEPEIVWFPKTKSLCIQSHPEFINDPKHPFVQHCLSLAQKYTLS